MLAYKDWVAMGDRVLFVPRHGEVAARIVPYGSATGGYEVHVQRRGDGPSCTLIHGFPTSSYDYAAIAEQLVASWSVLTFDFVGFGSSAKPLEYAYSTFERADLVEALWAYFGVECTHVIAHDFGVTVALELLARMKERAVRAVEISSLTLLNGAMYSDLHRATQGQKMLLSPGGQTFAKAVTREMFAMLIRSTLAPGSSVTDEHLGELWESVVAGTSSLNVLHLTIGYINDRLEHKDRWEPLMSDLPVRTKFIWGLEDGISGEHMFRRIEREVAGGGHELVPLENVGHYPQLEQPERVAAEVRNFLRSGG